MLSFFRPIQFHLIPNTMSSFKLYYTLRKMRKKLVDNVVKLSLSLWDDCNRKPLRLQPELKRSQ